MAREMKDSGIEWIGKIPANWQVCKQKHVIELINGRAYSDDEFEDGGKYRILRVGNLFTNPAWYTSSMELDSSKYCEDGDLLYAWSMSYAPVIWHGEKVIYHYHIWKVDLSILIDKLFAFYYLKVVTDALMAEKHETTMSFITMGVMNNSYIAYPDISDQHRIAAFLDHKCSEIDSVIADTQKTIDEYKALKQSIITEAVTKGVRGERKMKDSGVEWIGEVPEEWEVLPHKYVMHKEKNICEHYTGESILSLTMNGVIVRDLNAGGKMPTTFDGYQYVEPDDMLLCLFDIDVTPRCVGVVHNCGITSPAYSCFKVHKGFYNAYYDYLLRFIDDEKIFVHLAKNLRSSLTESDFGAIKTLAPTYEEQLEIATYLDAKCAEIDRLITAKQQLLTELESYKKSVIYEYVTGKKEVQ